MYKFFYVIFLCFITHVVNADYITSDLIGGCDENNLNSINNISNMYPVFTPNQYTCSSGKFLPAYSLECKSCPTGYMCNGGTFDFSDNEIQGIELQTYITHTTNNTCSTNFLNPVDGVSNMKPIFVPKVHSCTSGYYLPANIDECTICLKDHYCPGGILTFNETVSQGIEPCPEGTFAPMGSSMCYEHILHIGDDVVYLKSTKLTTPSLNIGMDDGVFYANMTTVPTPMNSATERHLKIEYDNQIYYVCDDTTYNSD